MAIFSYLQTDYFNPFREFQNTPSWDDHLPFVEEHLHCGSEDQVNECRVDDLENHSFNTLFFCLFDLERLANSLQNRKI